MELWREFAFDEYAPISPALFIAIVVVILASMIAMAVALWRRYLLRPVPPKSTRKQRVFDLLGGVIAPTLCFLFDPCLFKSWGDQGGAFLETYRLFAYAAFFTAAFAVVAWIKREKHIPLLSGLAAGVLFGGAACAMLVGLAILPFTIMGAMFGIGLLGLAPFWSAFVYWRNGCDAMRRYRDAPPRGWQWGIFLAGFLFLPGIPIVLQADMQISVAHAQEVIVSGDTGAEADAVKVLHRWRWFRIYNGLVREFAEETDPIVKSRISRLYRDATGRRIEDQLGDLGDR